MYLFTNQPFLLFPFLPLLCCTVASWYLLAGVTSFSSALTSTPWWGLLCLPMMAVLSLSAGLLSYSLVEYRACQISCLFLIKQIILLCCLNKYVLGIFLGYIINSINVSCLYFVFVSSTSSFVHILFSFSGYFTVKKKRPLMSSPEKCCRGLERRALTWEIRVLSSSPGFDINSTHKSGQLLSFRLVQECCTGFSKMPFSTQALWHWVWIRDLWLWDLCYPVFVNFVSLVIAQQRLDQSCWRVGWWEEAGVSLKSVGIVIGRWEECCNDSGWLSLFKIRRKVMS